MKAVILTLSVTAACWAGGAGKTACNSHNSGRLWPEEANTSSAAARRTAQTGELEVCSFTGWRYKWKPVSVSVSNLRKGKAAGKTAKQASEDAGASPEGAKVSQTFR